MLTKYFIDSEFIDDGKTIDLISIGIVCEDGRELYLQSSQFAPELASQWVKDNVIDHLKICPHAYPEFRREVYTNRIVHSAHGQCRFTRWSSSGGEYEGVNEDCFWRTHLQIRDEVLHFITPGDNVEFWGWCAGYDFVALCQIFGTMMDLPPGWPHYIHEFQQILDERGIPDDDLPKQEDGLHNALTDAKHLKKLWGYVVRNDCWQ